MQRWIIIFNLFVPPGFVQFLQYYYQSGCLYRLRALGERNQLDLTVGKLFLMNHFSCLGHLQHHVWVGEMGGKGERWGQLLTSACRVTDVPTRWSTNDTDLLPQTSQTSSCWAVKSEWEHSNKTKQNMTVWLFFCLCRGISILDVEGTHISFAFSIFWPCKFSRFSTCIQYKTSIARLHFSGGLHKILTGH